MKYRKPLEASLHQALAYLEGLDRNPVAATATLETLRAQLIKPLGDEGMPAENVIAELVRDVEGGILGSVGGRFFGWVIGGLLPSALAAACLTATWDPNSAFYCRAPARATVVEAPTA